MIGYVMQLFAWMPPFAQVAVTVVLFLFVLVAVLKLVAVIMDIIPIL